MHTLIIRYIDTIRETFNSLQYSKRLRVLLTILSIIADRNIVSLI